ncbi:baseplate wedge subunit and tail pin [Pectobacterium phage POP12]|nr:baseplate wedge subunit and tail pin [Pectobacterium phage POP12]
MKQEILIGNVVDDGQGDYLRRGGQKTNSNFSELYTQLGDGSVPHAAGAWKTYSQPILNPEFGQSWALNTTNNTITVNLPKGNANDYNKVIRLRDVWATWATRAVTLIPASGDTLKGSPNPKDLFRDYLDIELVYCSPGRWEYVENKQINKITTSELATVAKQSFIATQGQTDFIDIFGAGDSYNTRSLDVFVRGNLLYFDEAIDDSTDYGSPDPNSSGMIALDGHSIRLKYPCDAGDTVQFVTYLDGIANWRTSYEARTMKVYNTDEISSESVAGEIWVGDLANKHIFTNEELGISNRILVNPLSSEVFLNGRMLTKAGSADLPAFRCEGAEGYDEESCIGNSGVWTATGEDYSMVMVDSIVTGIKFGQALESGDIISLRWYNNDIGTIMDWEGVGGIKEKTDLVYLNNEYFTQRTNRIEYTDYNDPSQKTLRHVPDSAPSRILDVQTMFDVIYPIGSIYENAHNAANPSTYMGFGTWTRYGIARATIGWNPDDTDGDFSLNNNDLDSGGNPTSTSGGTGGNRSVEIQKINVPEIQSTEKVLISDANGAIVVGGCELDPDAQGPGYTKYREDVLKVNQGNTVPDRLGVLPPFVTVHRWIRVA